MNILAEEAWRYAAWVALDLRLLVFVTLIAALAAAGISALVVKSGRRKDFGAVFVLAMVVTLPLTIFLFNEVAHHPVFVVEAFFPFP